MKKKQKLWIGIGVGILVSVMTLVALYHIFLMLVFFGGPAESVKEVSEYEEILTKYDGKLRTALITFPERIPDSAQDADFYFWYKDTWDDPTVEVFLQCTYDDMDYRAEVERLENTKKTFGTIERVLMRDEEGRFPYPAYIAIDSHAHTYEYALLSGENQITYIHTTYKYEKTLRMVEAEYLPKDFDSRQNQAKFGEGYNIYLKPGDGPGWSCDYTRDK